MADDPTPRWLEWAREIQALSQTGQAFTKSHYDRLSFQRLEKIAARLAARLVPAHRHRVRRQGGAGEGVENLRPSRT